MEFRPENPVIVQSDKTILLETHSPKFEEAREMLAGFAELIKSPEYISDQPVVTMECRIARLVARRSKRRARRL